MFSFAQAQLLQKMSCSLNSSHNHQNPIKKTLLTHHSPLNSFSSLSLNQVYTCNHQVIHKTECKLNMTPYLACRLHQVIDFQWHPDTLDKIICVTNPSLVWLQWYLHRPNSWPQDVDMRFGFVNFPTPHWKNVFLGRRDHCATDISTYITVFFPNFLCFYFYSTW